MPDVEKMQNEPRRVITRTYSKSTVHLKYFVNHRTHDSLKFDEVCLCHYEKSERIFKATVLTAL